ncbi:hypothetical protein VTN31DRAFT_632 [Thermomyces dupontii]|uniref:uncharacterized protein n=1 Tax=Talaromyces thermophilus TaxID=28565 RepID=UPI003742C5D2
MPRAEPGSTKAISNKLKAKGLGRLRWYCQVCQKQMRDENGFKCHVQSESHVRQMLIVGENSKKYIDEYSQEFLRNFITLLRTTHGEKKVHVNQFYQQVIADKHHIHMNATKWSSLTQFAKYLGREGICRVEEDPEKGIFISWIDNSPETLRRREALLKKERQDKGDEEREKREIQEQVERARRQLSEGKESSDDIPEEAKMLQRKEGEKLKLNLSAALKSASKSDTDSSKDDSTPEPSKPKVGISLSGNGADKKPKNVFAAMKSQAKANNPLAGGKKVSVAEPPKKMTEQERIMKAELEAMERRKRREASHNLDGDAKRQRVS